MTESMAGHGTFRELALDPDPRWFPSFNVRVDAGVDLAGALDEFMVLPRGDDTEPCDRDTSAGSPEHTYHWTVYRTQARADRTPAALQMPRHQRLFTGPRPGQSFDLGTVRYQSMAGSTLWLSEAALAGTNYFLNMMRLSLVHGASTIGSAALHSALVDVEGAGVLLPGEAFSGKSSLAVFAMLAGGKLVSDDMVLVGSDTDDQPIGRTFRRTLLMRERTHKLLPAELQAHSSAASIGGITKYAYNRGALGDRVALSVPVRHVVFPSISLEPLDNAPYGYVLTPIDKATAFRQLLVSLDTSVTMRGLDSERARVSARLASLVAKSTCHSLEMDSRFLDDAAGNCSHLLDCVQASAERIAGNPSR